MPQMTPSDLVDTTQRFNAPSVKATREFARSKPWRGSIEERKAKLVAYHAAISDAYGLNTRLAFEIPDKETSSAASSYSVRDNLITIRGKVSVITYLYLLACARGLGIRKSVTWTVSLFARFFPRSFERLEFGDGLLISRPAGREVPPADQLATPPGTCRICGEPAVENSNLCESCTDRACGH